MQTREGCVDAGQRNPLAQRQPQPPSQGLAQPPTDRAPAGVRVLVRLLVRVLVRVLVQALVQCARDASSGHRQNQSDHRRAQPLHNACVPERLGQGPGQPSHRSRASPSPRTELRSGRTEALDRQAESRAPAHFAGSCSTAQTQRRLRVGIQRRLPADQVPPATSSLPAMILGPHLQHGKPGRKRLSQALADATSAVRGGSTVCGRTFARDQRLRHLPQPVRNHPTQPTEPAPAGHGPSRGREPVACRSSSDRAERE